MILELKGSIDDLTEKARTAKQLTLKQRIEEQISDARYETSTLIFMNLSFLFSRAKIDKILSGAT